MPGSPKDNRDMTAAPQADLQKMLERGWAQEHVTSPLETKLVADARIPEFRYRVLVVDDYDHGRPQYQ